ncbi:MAG: HD domain-containing protein [Planctomycetota bacterium]|nr:HD domain-containing protein [Planctomycetota bacterium]
MRFEGISVEKGFYLQFTSGKKKGLHIPLLDESRLVFGRDATCDVVLDEVDISARHMLLEKSGGSVRVIDLDSRNGVFVNDVRVRSSLLSPGDVVRLGASVVMNLVAEGVTASVFARQEPMTTRILHASAVEPKTAAITPLSTTDVRLRSIVDVIDLIHQEWDTHRILGRIVDVVDSVFAPDRSFVILKDKQGNLMPAVFKQKDGTTGGQISYTIVRKVVEERTALVTQDAGVDERFKAGMSIVIGGIRSAMCAPIAMGNNVLGALYIDTVGRQQAFSSIDLELLSVIAKQAALALHRAQLMKSVEKAYYSTVRVMVAAVEAKDEYTKGHSERVTTYSLRLADHVGLTGKRLDILRLAALLHDIGKIGVPEHILNKADKLSYEEFGVIRRHPDVGYKIIKNIDSDDAAEVARIVRYHHERYDGKGYPDGISGKEIPIFARLIAVCDTYDAMTSHRPYRPPMPKEKVIEELERGSGVQWDSAITTLMLKLVKEGEIVPI